MQILRIKLSSRIFFVKVGNCIDREKYRGNFWCKTIIVDEINYKNDDWSR